MSVSWHDEKLESFDGLELMGRHACPAAAQAIVIFIHGYGDSIAQHQVEFDALLRKGCEVYAFDLRGHGRSGGTPGYANRFEHFLDDLDLIWARVQNRKERLPSFIIGHDLGALIAVSFVASRKPLLAGLSLCALPLHLPLSSKDQFLSRLASGLAPKKLIGSEKLAFLAGGGQPDTGASPRHGMPARLINELQRNYAELQDQFGSIKVPILLIQAQSDPYTDTGELRHFHDLAMSYEKKCHWVDLPERRVMGGSSQAVMQVLLDWVVTRIKSPIDLGNEGEFSDELLEDAE